MGVILLLSIRYISHDIVNIILLSKPVAKGGKQETKLLAHLGMLLRAIVTILLYFIIFNSVRFCYTTYATNASWLWILYMVNGLYHILFTTLSIFIFISWSCC